MRRRRGGQANSVVHQVEYDAEDGAEHGFGIAVARELAERNGSTLRLDVSGSGAAFVFELPGVCAVGRVRIVRGPFGWTWQWLAYQGNAQNLVRREAHSDTEVLLKELQCCENPNSCINATE